MPGLKERTLGPVFRYLAGLRFPTLMTLTTTLFVANVLIPDGIPFADEILLGVASALLASWKKRSNEPDAP